MDEDLFGFAIGEEEVDLPSTSKENETSEENVEEENSWYDPTHRYAKVIQELIIVHRKTMSKQQKEIERLKSQLEASGVVKCPNCTHHFKERQHAFKPKYMRVLRKCSRLEMEFSTLEDMETWLYLNMLDVNADNLPTLTHPPDESRPTLANVGSRLPALVAEAKKSEKRDEEVKTMVSAHVPEKPSREQRSGPPSHEQSERSGPIRNVPHRGHVSNSHRPYAESNRRRDENRVTSRFADREKPRSDWQPPDRRPVRDDRRETYTRDSQRNERWSRNNEKSDAKETR